MNIKREKQKLDDARKRQRDIRKEIDALRQKIRDAGEDPDLPKVDLTQRNKKIYKRWKDGLTYVQLAAEFDLSVTTVGSVCRRIEHALETNNWLFERYKDLLDY